jgi:hypothetical protein
MTMSTPSVEAIAMAIANYLDQHPDAADSAEGIQRWWIGSGFRDVSVEMVQSALGLLEARQVVKATAVQEGRRIYRRRGVGYKKPNLI